MPSNRTHNLIGRRLAGGSSTDWVDRTMDAPAAWLGKKHRILFHDQATVLAMLMGAGPQAAARAQAHIVADQMVSAAKRAFLLELAKQGVPKPLRELIVDSIRV